MKEFLLCFVPLFVAVDAIGVLPIFIGLTAETPPSRIPGLVAQSMATATVVAVLFLIVGVAVLNLMGITVADFMVAGGTLLFVISMGDLLATNKTRPASDSEDMGAVPIGVPLITGPAVLTTSILLLRQHGALPTLMAVLVNIFLAGVVFLFAGPITRFLGRAGTKTLSKIASLFLAAVAVMMVRKGVFALIAAAR